MSAIKEESYVNAHIRMENNTADILMDAAERSKKHGDESVLVFPSNVDGVCASFVLTRIFGGRALFAGRTSLPLLESGRHKFAASFGIQGFRGCDFSLSFGKKTPEGETNNILLPGRSLGEILSKILPKDFLSEEERAVLVCGDAWIRWRSGGGASRTVFPALLAVASLVEKYGSESASMTDIPATVKTLLSMGTDDKEPTACLASLGTEATDEALERIESAGKLMTSAKKNGIECPEGFSAALERGSLTNLSRLLWVLPTPLPNLSDGKRRILIGKSNGGRRRILLGCFQCRNRAAMELKNEYSPHDFLNAGALKSVFSDGFLDMYMEGSVDECMKKITEGVSLSEGRRKAAEAAEGGLEAGF